MMTVTAHPAYAASDWRALVEECRGHPLHLPEVQLVEHECHDLLYLVFERPGGVVACSVAVDVSRRVIGRRFGPRTLYLPTAPALRDDAAAGEVYHELADFGRRAGFSTLVIEASWGGRPDEHPPFEGHASTRLVEFVIDLRPSVEDLLSAMHKVHRKNIRKADHAGLQLTSDASLDGLLCLRELQLDAARRGGEGGPRFAVRDAGYFRRAFDRVYSPGLGQVLFARLDDQVVAGLAYLVACRRALTVRSGATLRGYDSRAMYFLQFELIKRAKEQGWSELNIGGVPVEAQDPSHPQWGLYEFKKGFGGTPAIRAGIRMPLR